MKHHDNIVEPQKLGFFLRPKPKVNNSERVGRECGA